MCGSQKQQPNWNQGFGDKYVLHSKVLGQGAFSKVYLGSNSSKSEDVAIKVIDKIKLNEEELERLAAEVSILSEVPSHKNILSECCNNFVVSWNLFPQKIIP